MSRQTKTATPVTEIPDAPEGNVPGPALGANERLDTRTGEIRPDATAQLAWSILETYLQRDVQPFEKRVDEILRAPIPKDEIEIKADQAGLIYAPQARIRQRLCEAFGAGGWKLVPVRPGLENASIEGDRVIYPARLYAHGPGGWRFVSEAIGGQKYVRENPEMDWSAAIEAAKTDSLTRCVKDLGLGIELWIPGYAEEWRAQYAVEVWVKGAKGSRVDGKTSTRWRRFDDEGSIRYPWEEAGIKTSCSRLKERDGKSKGPSKAEDPPLGAVAAAPTNDPGPPEGLTSKTRGAIFAAAKELGYTPEEVRAEADLGTPISKMTEEQGQAFLAAVKTWVPANPSLGDSRLMWADASKYVRARGKDPVKDGKLLDETIRWASKRVRGGKEETFEDPAVASEEWRRHAHERLLGELQRLNVAPTKPDELPEGSGQASDDPF